MFAFYIKKELAQHVTLFGTTNNNTFSAGMQYRFQPYSSILWKRLVATLNGIPNIQHTDRYFWTLDIDFLIWSKYLHGFIYHLRCVYQCLFPLAKFLLLLHHTKNTPPSERLLKNYAGVNISFLC